MGIFKKKKKGLELSGDSVPKGVSRTLPRPSEDDIKRIRKDVDNIQNYVKRPNVDQLFIQEISDRLFGPDSDEYMEAIKEINSKFRKRSGKSGLDFYEPELVDKNKQREKEINNSIRKETV